MIPEKGSPVFRKDHAQTKESGETTFRRKVVSHQSMIPEKWNPVFRKDHAQTKELSEATFRRKVASRTN
jgi:hypothetical protein